MFAYIYIMLTCIARGKQAGDGSTVDQSETAAKSLTSQIKGIALKASKCTQPPKPPARAEPELSDRFRWSYRRTGSLNSSHGSSRQWGKELEARLKGISSGEGTLASASGRRAEPPVVFVEECEPKEWVAQVEPGVLITFVSMPGGGNDLKRIRFSRDMFNKWQAQRWWTENYEKVMELYNVKKLNRQAFPLPATPKSEEENQKLDSSHTSPMTPSLTCEHPPHTFFRPVSSGLSCSSCDSLDHHPVPLRYNYDSAQISTPKLSSISGAKTETSSVDVSSSSRDADRSEDLSMSNVSEIDNEWVEEDEPGVYITIRALPSGKRELRRVRFSREKFGEVHARLWWDENRARVHKQYL